MASIAETVTRICDDVTRPESELGAFAGREILSAITFYESKRLIFNERKLTVTLTSGVPEYPYSFLAASDPEVEDIIAIDDPIKALYGGREDNIWLEPWRDLRAADSLGVATTVPSCWSHWNNTVRFYPSPNNALVVNIEAHVRLTTLLSQSGGTLPNTNAWLTDGEELIRNRATRMVWAKKLQDMEMANLYQNLETEAYARIMQAAGARHITGRLAVNY